MTNLLDLSIRELRRKLDSKEVSALELAKEAISRAKTTNTDTNAYITITEEEALAQAKSADKAIAQNKATLLTGIPYGMKDVYLTPGISTTSSSNILKNYKPQYSATVYKKLLQQSAVLVGKHNHDAWGHGGSSENSDFGRVNNPWDLSRTAGGSSGGSAAALASRTISFGIGEDTGGSIRNPSHFCGTTGLKVTYGRVSRYGAIAYASSLDTVGPMARSVEDVSDVLQVIAGFDSLDASSSRVEVPDYRSLLERPIPKNLKIGVVKEYMNSKLGSDVSSMLSGVFKQYQKMGAEIVELSLPTLTYGHSIYYILALSETSSNLARYDGIRYGSERNNFTADTKRRIMMGTFALSVGYYDAFYKKALQARTQLIKEFDQAYEKVDAIIAPVMPFAAYEFGKMDTDEDYIVSMYLADIYTCATNPVGIPSLALPGGFSESGLPVGYQLMGPMFSEGKLLNLGYHYQKATDWHTKKPAIGAK